MQITRRNALLGAASLPFLGALNPAFAQNAKISVGHVTASDFAPIVVGPQKGLFAKHGVDVTAVKLPIIVHTPPGLVSNSIQIGAATIPVLLAAVDGGLDLVLVSGGSRHVREQSKIGLAVRSDFNYSGPGDLKGKKIAVAGLNSTMDIFVRKWMKDRGVDLREVKMIEAQFPAMPDMLKGGVVDAAVVTDPIRSRIVESGQGKIVSDFFAEMYADVLMICYIATRQWADANRKTIEGFRAGLVETDKWMSANWAEASAMEKQAFGFTSAKAPTGLSIVATPADLKVYIDVGNEFGLYQTKLDPEKLIWK